MLHVCSSAIKSHRLLDSTSTCPPNRILFQGFCNLILQGTVNGFNAELTGTKQEKRSRFKNERITVSFREEKIIREN